MNLTYRLIGTCLIIILLACYGCKKERGCTDKYSLSYDPNAEEDDGSCKYYGKAIFYVNAMNECGPIEVFCAGDSGTITRATKVIPVCGDIAGATFEDIRSSGNYEFLAVDSCHVWHDIVYLEINKCSAVLLTQ